jgi:hypothetical protein
MSQRLCIAALLSLAPFGAAHADMTWSASWRSRIEQVSQDGPLRDAVAPTSRLRVGAAWQARETPWRALLEIEGVAGLGSRYNSGANGATQYAAVTDPDGAEVNQVAAGWRNAGWDIVAGRQRLGFDNQRFIGNSGWRQNEQTFDALHLQFTRAGFEWRYAWLDRVHRVAGDHARDRRAREHALDGHALHLARSTSWGSAAAYLYLVEDRTVPAASSRSVGLRWSPDPQARFGLMLEAARQSDYGSHAAPFSHRYGLVEAAAHVRGLTWKGGIERLGGDGRHAFQTPLASLHPFNGWADVFVVTPPAGLEDRYAGVGGAWTGAQTAWNVSWHDFVAARGSQRYGREWDASLTKTLSPAWNALAKLAFYDADGFSSDTAKLWLQLEWTH